MGFVEEFVDRITFEHADEVERVLMVPEAGSTRLHIVVSPQSLGLSLPALRKSLLDMAFQAMLEVGEDIKLSIHGDADHAGLDITNDLWACAIEQGEWLWPREATRVPGSEFGCI